MSDQLTFLQNPTQEIIGRFVDQFSANQRNRDALGVEQQRVNNEKTFQSGQLDQQRKQFELLQSKYNDEKLKADALEYIARLGSIHDAVQSTQDPNQQAALQAEAKSLTDGVQQSRPELMPYIKLAALAPILTPERQATLNTSKFKQDQTAIAAGGGTDPNAVNFTTKMATGAYQPSEGFKQQQAVDLGARDKAPGGITPKLSAKIPSPSGDAVSDYEARSTNALPTSAENLNSQTQLTQQAMSEKGATERAKIAHQIDPGVASAIVQGVLDDPQSFYGLPPDDKKAVLQTLGRAPSKLSAAESERINAAQLGRQIIDDSDVIVKKWQARGTPITGPALGRFNAAQGTWGDMLIPKNLPPDQQKEYAEDISQLREWLTALPIQEAKALAGGRTAYQVIQAVTAAAPSLSKGQDMFEGSVKGLRTRFEQTVDHFDKKQWGGKPPKGYVSTKDRGQDQSDPLGLFK